MPDVNLTCLTMRSKRFIQHGARTHLFMRKGIFFQEWLSFHRERYVEKRNEDAVSERSRLQIEKRRIRKRWDDYRSEWHDEDPIRSSCCIGVCKCPICGENTTYSVLAGKYYTYWSGDPNNSPSVLYCPEEKHLECMCCIARDEEAMHWTNFEIRNYEAMHGPLFDGECKRLGIVP